MRTDGREKASGSAKYSADIFLPGMLHGKIVRSPLPHARIVGFDIAEASRVEGVKAIVTGHDCPRTLWGYLLRDQNILAWEKVRFVGDPVAAVAAETIEAAEEAARLVRVQYEPLPAVFTSQDALRQGAPLVHERSAEYKGLAGERSGNRMFNCAIRRGDIERAFATADLVVEDEFLGHIAHPTQLEPHASVTRLAADGTLEIWTATQSPFFVRNQVADVLGLPLERVRLIATHIGGGFGNKLIMCLEPICALLTLQTQAPVRIVMTREEEFETTITRHAIRTTIRTALDRSGNMIGRHVRLVLDKGAYADHGPNSASISTLQAVGPYRIEHIDVEAECIYTNKVPSGAYRAPTGPQVNFAVESHMDHIAGRLGVDPIDFRLQNALREGDLSPTGQRLRGVGLAETLQRARTASSWDSRHGRLNDGPTKRGIGVACGWWLTGGGITTARVKVLLDGRVQIQSGMEIGTGAFTSGVVKIVAEKLGLDEARIEAVRPDTVVTPYDPGSFGSRSLFMSGAAATLACEKLLAAIREIAAVRLGVAVDEIEIMNGVARGRTGKSTSFADLAKFAATRGEDLFAEAKYEIQPEVPKSNSSTLISHFHPAWLAPSFYTAVAEVEVDTETGRVQATRLIHVQDTGRVIDPVGVAGQIRGGVVQALGYALSEELVIEDGVVRNPNLLDYRVPTSVDVPPIEHILVEGVAPDGLVGSKGVGEAPIVAVSSAIANAFSNATRVRPHRLPLSPENVFWTLANGEES